VASNVGPQLGLEMTSFTLFDGRPLFVFGTGHVAVFTEGECFHVKGTYREILDQLLKELEMEGD
jgi:hypothetical protein